MSEQFDTNSDHVAMLAIQETLSGVEWSSDTLEEIAQIVIKAGYKIHDIDGVEQT